MAGIGIRPNGYPLNNFELTSIIEKFEKRLKDLERRVGSDEK